MAPIALSSVSGACGRACAGRRIGFATGSVAGVVADARPAADSGPPFASRPGYHSALNRIEHGKPLNAVEKPKVFDHVFYESPERLVGRPNVVFELWRDDGSRFSYPATKLIHIAGMVRHLAKEQMTKSPPHGV